MAKRLTQEDWIAAGFRALAKDGPRSIKAETLARQLGTSKGSFYWHFKDVPAFHAAMLDLWEASAATDIIAALEPLPDPKTRLRALAARTSSPAPDRLGGALVEPAIRAWALENATAAARLAKVDVIRIGYLRKLLGACSRSEDYAELIYATYLGFDDLQARGMSGSRSALSDVVELILSHPRE